LIAALVVVPAAELLALASVRRVDLQVLAHGVRCILRAARRAVDLLVHAPVLASVLVVDRVDGLDLEALALEWVVVPAD
jgi:hypothetical protein